MVIVNVNENISKLFFIPDIALRRFRRKLLFDKFSEYEHLERILLDAVCTDSVDYELTADAESEAQRTEKYQKYHRDHYTPEPHFRRDN